MMFRPSKPEEERRADLRGFIRSERAAIKRVLEGIKDDRYKLEEYLDEHLHPRPQPTFRQVKRGE